ncbi:MAG: TonB-dependent receptor plug domain-containing protein, partial [Salinibacter sp.]|uniref:TonB-dependent receptor plug domain-containing protein n=1 Tax=Salinibacter sp. TaxID=2065818 RepID=UPI002FC295A3
PASVSVLEPVRIRRAVPPSSVEALRAVEGVGVAQTGVGRREVALRGFNSAFSTGPHVRTDHREAAAPALGLNLYSVMPNTSLDLDRIEAVRGPAGALYGTGVDGGGSTSSRKTRFGTPARPSPSRADRASTSMPSSVGRAFSETMWGTSLPASGGAPMNGRWIPVTTGTPRSSGATACTTIRSRPHCRG